MIGILLGLLLVLSVLPVTVHFIVRRRVLSQMQQQQVNNINLWSEATSTYYFVRLRIYTRDKHSLISSETPAASADPDDLTSEAAFEIISVFVRLFLLISFGSFLCLHKGSLKSIMSVYMGCYDNFLSKQLCQIVIVFCLSF